MSGLVDTNYFGYHLGSKKDDKQEKDKGKKGEEEEQAINPMTDSINILKIGIESLL